MTIGVQDLDDRTFNPFGATAQELLAHAMDDAGLLCARTRIAGRPARELLDSFYRKRENYRESTKLGDLFERQGLLSHVQVVAALELQRQREGLRFGEALLALGLCSRPDIERGLAEQHRIREDLELIEEHLEKVSEIRERLPRGA